MAINVKVTVPPAIEPVTLAQAKAHLRVDWADDDAYISDLITSARQWLERGLNRALITQTIQATMDLPLLDDARGPAGGVVGRPSRLAFDLPYANPLQSVTTLEMETDVATWATLTLDNPPASPGDYRVVTDAEPGRVWLHPSALFRWMPSWDWGGAVAPRFRVTYVAGYGPNATDVPMNIRQAMYRAVAHQYENREAAGAIPDSLLPMTHVQGWL